MGKQAFTPGDWEASGPFVRTPLVANDRGGCDGGFAVAAIHPNVKDADAAARLMAAAPEVYAALAECVAELEAYDAPSDPMDSHNVRLAKARAALAKAVMP